MVDAGLPHRAARIIMSETDHQRIHSSDRIAGDESRSPFVRLTELLSDITPGKPPINLSVGEPQHPVPPFVGPVLEAHIVDFGRYPANKGIEPYRQAAAGWLGRRFTLPRPIDPEHE
jgi:aspartate/methionine/tyrosine aminotransferase